MFNVRVRLRTFCVMVFAIAMPAAGCGTHIDKIIDLNDNPTRYLHQTVTIAGQVTQVFGLPLGVSNLAAYRVDDGTGRIWVISHDGPPEPDRKVGVKGELEPITTLNLGPLHNPFGNVIEESERRQLQ